MRFLKSDSVRVVFGCGNKGEKVGEKKGGKKCCPYRIWASWMSTQRSFHIKDIVDKHKCSKNFNNSSIMTLSCLEILERVD